MTQNRHARLLRAYLEHNYSTLDTDRPVNFSTWLQTGVSATVAVGASLLIANCGGYSTSGTEARGEGACEGPDCSAQCADGLDNDADGTIDCSDSECAGVPACSSSGGTSGVGGVDGGGLDAGYAMPFETDCADGVDNDSNGLVDCNDPDCTDAAECYGAGGVGVAYGIPYETDCTNGVDDDYDGATDCADPDCSASSAYCSGDGGSGGSGGIPLYAIPY